MQGPQQRRDVRRFGPVALKTGVDEVVELGRLREHEAWGLVPISSMTLYTLSAMCASSFGILLSVHALASFTCVLTQGVTVSLLIGARETFRNSTSDPSDCSAIRPRSAVASEPSFTRSPL